MQNVARLGQNFLISKDVAKKIVKTARVKKEEVVLEIGPGKGILTEELIKTGAKVIAVEKDTRLFRILEKKFPNVVNLKLINADVRDLLQKYPKKGSGQNVRGLVSDIAIDKVVANIPYYLTGQLIRLLLNSAPPSGRPMDHPKNSPNNLILMVQKEVAERITAKDRKESILSLSVKAFAEPKTVFKVPGRAFRPQPKVDSAVIMLEKLQKNIFESEKIDQNLFFELIKTGFSSKRKMLAGNLKKYSPKPAFKKCRVPEKTRAEDLGLKQWVCLAKNIK